MELRHAYNEGVFDNGGHGCWLTCCEGEEDDGRGGGHRRHHRDTPILVIVHNMVIWLVSPQR